MKYRLPVLLPFCLLLGLAAAPAPAAEDEAEAPVYLLHIGQNLDVSQMPETLAMEEKFTGYLEKYRYPRAIRVYLDRENGRIIKEFAFESLDEFEQLWPEFEATVPKGNREEVFSLIHEIGARVLSDERTLSVRKPDLSCAPDDGNGNPYWENDLYVEVLELNVMPDRIEPFENALGRLAELRREKNAPGAVYAGLRLIGQNFPACWLASRAPDAETLEAWKAESIELLGDEGNDLWNEMLRCVKSHKTNRLVQLSSLSYLPEAPDRYERVMDPLMEAESFIWRGEPVKSHRLIHAAIKGAYFVAFINEETHRVAWSHGGTVERDGNKHVKTILLRPETMSDNPTSGAELEYEALDGGRVRQWGVAKTEEGPMEMEMVWKPADSGKDAGDKAIEGVWTRREEEWIANNEPFVAYKAYQNGEFIVALFNMDTNDIAFVHGGTYTCANGKLVENIEYAGESTEVLIGQSIEFEIELDGDAFRQTGQIHGDPLDQHWRRAE